MTHDSSTPREDETGARQNSDSERVGYNPPDFDKKTLALCDIDECEELARYVETGDGHAVRDPKRRCHEHHSNHGLWRDLAWSIAREFHMEEGR